MLTFAIILCRRHYYDLAHMVSNIKRGRRELTGPTPKMLTFFFNLGLICIQFLPFYFL